MFVGKAAFEEVLGSLSANIEADVTKRQDAAKQIDIRPKPESLSSITMYGVVAQDKSFSVVLGSFGTGFWFTGGSANVSIHSYILSEVEHQQKSKSVLVNVDTARLIAASSVSSIFVPKLLTTLRLRNSFHLVYDVPVVGSLSIFLKAPHQAIPLPPKAIEYIAASIISALEFLHGQGILYRNINPEAVYFDADGKIVITDCSFSKVGGIGAKCYTVCGGAEYLSPEQISQVGHSAEVDLWALGVTLYELAVNEHPFTAKNEVATFAKIASYGSGSFMKLLFPAKFSVDTELLISQLLKRNPGDRLGAGDNWAALKAHKLFQNSVDWSQLGTKSYPSPLFSVATSEAALSAAETVDSKITDLWNSDYTGDLVSLWES